MMSSDSSLDHETRRLVFNYISKHPGVSFGDIRGLFDLTESTLRYHLKYLERARRIRSKTNGGRRSYYSTAVRLRDDDGIEYKALSKAQQRILTVAQKHPGITVGELVKKTNLHKRVVQYNVRKLKEQLLLRKIGDGGTPRYEFITKEGLGDELLKLIVVKFLKDEIDEETYLYLKEQLRKEGLDES